jgi:hypothetical protein
MDAALDRSTLSDMLSWQVMHLLFLIVTESQYYNTHQRLSSIVRLLEAVTIRRARDFVLAGQGNMVFADDCQRATKRLEVAIDSCFALKQMYRDYQEFNDARLPKGALNIYASAGTGAASQFARLDACVERFHDLLSAAT